jgi:hypothetical protein
MEGWRSLHGELGVTVTPRDIPERKLRKIGAGIQRSLLQLQWSRELTALGRKARFVVRRQDFGSSQILLGVHVLGSLLLLFAGTFLTRRFRGILRLLRAALRSAEKQTRAEEYSKAATEGFAQRHLGMNMLLARTGEVSARHLHQLLGNVRCRNTKQS